MNRISSGVDLVKGKANASAEFIKDKAGGAAERGNRRAFGRGFSIWGTAGEGGFREVVWSPMVF